MIEALKKSKFIYWVGALFLIALAWWIYLQRTEAATAYQYYAYYGFIGLSGGLYGIWLSIKKWGGFKSVVGRGLIFISLGLIGQWFGTMVWAYYNIVAKVAVPYPSWADLGYFSLIPAYSFAAYEFGKASGIKFSLRSVSGKIQAFIVPVAALGLAYGLFLKDVGIDTSNVLKLILDIGYPLGEIIPVTIAVLTLLLSRKFLGGVMKSRVRWLIFAFFVQFVTEYTFIYLVGAELYRDGGWDSLLYPLAYFIMAIGIIGFSQTEVADRQVERAE